MIQRNHSTSCPRSQYFVIFFFNDPATTEIYTLSLHDALPISSAPGATRRGSGAPPRARTARTARARSRAPPGRDRKSTRLNSSHMSISYAVFCLKKKKTTTTHTKKFNKKTTYFNIFYLYLNHT